MSGTNFASTGGNEFGLENWTTQQLEAALQTPGADMIGLGNTGPGPAYTPPPSGYGGAPPGAPAAYSPGQMLPSSPQPWASQMGGGSFWDKYGGKISSAMQAYEPMQEQPVMWGPGPDMNTPYANFSNQMAQAPGPSQYVPGLEWFSQ